MFQVWRFCLCTSCHVSCWHYGHTRASLQGWPQQTHLNSCWRWSPNWLQYIFKAKGKKLFLLLSPQVHYKS